MKRFAGTAFMTLVVLSVAVTPLSAVIRPSDFEASFRTFGFCGSDQATAFLHDETGLVQGLAMSVPSQEPQLAPTKTLFVDWEGDSDVTAVWMEFFASGGRYRVDLRTAQTSCPIGVGLSIRFVLFLRAPVDPTGVDVIGGSTAVE